MSLGIVFKGPEGIVLAADSRVTLTAQVPGQNMLMPATFDNATKLLKVTGQDYVGVVTYGLGAIGTSQPRTAHSFLPEFEDELSKGKVTRLSVRQFTQRLSDFFMRLWATEMPAAGTYQGPDMTFFIGGFDEGEAYGKVFQIDIPRNPAPREWHDAPGMFGPVWGGQSEYTNRLINGFDPRVCEVVARALQMTFTPAQIKALQDELNTQFNSGIPFQFLPLQDCVDLSIFLIRTTITLQSWVVGVRGVGGAIDVATITRMEGFKPLQQKKMVGERN